MVKGLPAEWGACFHTVSIGGWTGYIVCWKDTVAIGSSSSQIDILNGITGSQVAILSGHTNRVRALAFSLDGALLVSGSDDHAVKLWDMQTGGVVKTMHGHTSCVLSVSISVDYTTIASGSDDGTIHLWGVHTGECHCILELQEPVNCVRFSPTNPQCLVSSTLPPGKVQQWNIDGHQIGPAHDGSYVAFSPDGTQFVSSYGTAVVVRNTDSRMIVAEFQVASSNIKHCCFSPDGRHIAVATEGTIYVWDTTHLVPCIVGAFFEPASFITSLIFSSPSSLASSLSSGPIRFWQIGALQTDPVTNQMSTPLTSAQIKFITLCAKDRIAISSDSDGVVRTWDITTGICKSSFQTPAKNHSKGHVQLINGRCIFVWGEIELDDERTNLLYKATKIHTWDVEKGELLHQVDAPFGIIEDIKISGDGSKVFCLCNESIRAWSIWTGEVVGEVKVGPYNYLPGLLVVDGSRVSIGLGPLPAGGSRTWMYSSEPGPQSWDFGIPGLPPVGLSSIPSPHLSDILVWNTCSLGIMDVVTGKVVLQLAGRFAIPVDAQCDGQYLVAGYNSGEVLILDYNHMSPK